MKLLTCLALIFMLAQPAKAECDYFSNVRFHPGLGNPHDAYVYFEVNPEPGESNKYTAVGLANLTETCLSQDGSVVWSKTEYLSRTYSSTYSARFDGPGEHSAQIRGTNSPATNNFPYCFAPNTLHLDSVNWLAVTLYDLTDLDEGVVCSYPAVRD